MVAIDVTKQQRKAINAVPNKAPMFMTEILSDSLG
jgi:hypothetical protein